MSQALDDKVSILIIDDELESRFFNRKEAQNIFSEVHQDQLQIEAVETIDEGLEYLKDNDVHVVLLDYSLGETEELKPINGVDFIPNILSIRPSARVLVLTSFHDTELAVKAIKSGAMDFLNKGPDESISEYRKAKIKQALRDSKAEIDAIRRTRLLKIKNEDQPYPSKAMKSFDMKLKTLSETNTSVLLLGESGLGKTYAARRLSDLTKKYKNQKNRVFINLNMNSLPENLIESELFGAEVGAYTGLKETKIGLLEQASEGDFFWDEIGDASLEFQGKILKLLEEKTYMRLGGKDELRTTARFIFATNKNLEELVEQGKFREDLLARISLIKLDLPELRDRKEDIPLICDNICDELSKEHEKDFSYVDFPENLKQHFLRDYIPFNIRGIRNDLERLAIFCKTDVNGRLNLRHWRSHISGETARTRRSHKEKFNFDDVVEYLADQIAENSDYVLNSVKKEIEKAATIKVFKKYKKNKARAVALGLSDSNASQKIKEHIGRNTEADL